jgi:hypothetical protein
MLVQPQLQTQQVGVVLVEPLIMRAMEAVAALVVWAAVGVEAAGLALAASPAGALAVMEAAAL